MPQSIDVRFGGDLGALRDRRKPKAFGMLRLSFPDGFGDTAALAAAIPMEAIKAAQALAIARDFNLDATLADASAFGQAIAARLTEKLAAQGGSASMVELSLML